MGCQLIRWRRQLGPHIMLRDLLTQKFVQKKRLLILDTPEHVDSEKPNRQIDTNFFQNVI
jgi:hypothetical protein